MYVMLYIAEIFYIVYLTFQKTTKVEEIFLGPNAGLVNLDSLVTDLPPPSSINPFGLPPSATPPTARTNNPFDMGKAPAPSLQELQMGSSGFGKLKVVIGILTLYVVVFLIDCS